MFCVLDVKICGSQGLEYVRGGEPISACYILFSKIFHFPIYILVTYSTEVEEDVELLLSVLLEVMYNTQAKIYSSGLCCFREG